MNRAEMLGRAARTARALGHGHHRRRRRRHGRRRRCGVARLRRAARRAARLRQGHVEPFHEARARRRPLSRAGRDFARDGGAQGARPPAPERAAPGARPRVRRPELRMVGSAVLRRRPQGVRHARRPLRLRRIARSSPRKKRSPACRRSRPRACAAASCTTTGSSTMRGC